MQLSSQQLRGNISIHTILHLQIRNFDFKGLVIHLGKAYTYHTAAMYVSLCHIILLYVVIMLMLYVVSVGIQVWGNTTDFMHCI